MKTRPFAKAVSKAVIFSTVCAFSSLQCYAEYTGSAFEPIKTINPNTVNTTSTEVTIDLNQNGTKDIKKVFLSKNDSLSASVNATDKFVQCNIRAAWEDFKNVIKNSEDNDFVYLSLASKMAGLGFFDLSNLAIKNMQDTALTGLSVDAMKRFYYPAQKMRHEDELFLAEVYSNIMFNNQSSEATNELLKKDNLLERYDYANYLVALGSYKSNFISRAAKYINIALIQNPSNLNYHKLKAEILAEDGKTEEAIKTVEFLKKQNLYSFEYERKVQATEQYVLYKTKKNQWEKDYHLGYYCYLDNDPSKALRTLQTALGAKHSTNKGMIYALMSEIYFNTFEFEKAADTAQKAHKLEPSNPKSLLTLGDLSFRNNNYKQALTYYKKATVKDKKDYIPLIKEAQAYQKLNDEKKATELFTKVLKTHSDSWEAYYNIALLQPDKTEIYLKKSLAVNPKFENGWIELAKYQIDRGNFEDASKYLSNAFYIDENNFKYYYYQGLLCQNTGDLLQAKYNYKKCLKLNSSHKEAQEALDWVLHEEDRRKNTNFNQDSI